MRQRKPIESLTIWGEEYVLEYRPSGREAVMIIPEAKKIEVNSGQHRPETETVTALVQKRLMIRAKEIITTETGRLAGERNIKYGKIRVKNTRSRFGSCSGDDNLNFNWQIILFPIEKARHVILHELAHVMVKNHSREFWQLLAKWDWQWRENRWWLRHEATRLMVFS